MSAPDPPAGGPATAEAGADPGSERASLLRSSGVMALGTTASRVLGFVRAIVVASAIGTGLLGDTYGVGNSLPNIIYILIAGGALNAVFVPQLVRAMEQPDGGRRFTDALMTFTVLGLGLLTVLATVGAPWIVRAYASSNWSTGDVRVATLFAYWCLPQIFFYGLYTMLGQVLNARGRFGPMMWTPILNNVVVIATGLLFIGVATVDFRSPASASEREIALLGAGTTLGIAVQALALLPVARSVGFRWRPSLAVRGIGLRQTGTLAGWTLLFVAVNQIAYLFVVQVSTGASKEALADGVNYGVGFNAYQNAYLIVLLPHSIATVSIVTALLPRMSRAAAQSRLGDIAADVASGLRTTAVATIPATVAFLALGRDMTAVMFARAGAADARYIGQILSAFALGLVLFSAQHLVLRGFYALQDTRTPFLIQVAIAAANIGLVLLAAVTLPARWTTVGMALGYAVSYAVGLLISTLLLRRRVGRLDGHRVLRTHVRLLLAAGLPGVAAWGAARGVTAGLGTGVAAELAAVAAGGLVLLAGFLGLAKVLHIREVSDLFGALRGRLGR